MQTADSAGTQLISSVPHVGCMSRVYRMFWDCEKSEGDVQGVGVTWGWSGPSASSRMDRERMYSFSACSPLLIFLSSAARLLSDSATCSDRSVKQSLLRVHTVNQASYVCALRMCQSGLQRQRGQQNAEGSIYLLACGTEHMLHCSKYLEQQTSYASVKAYHRTPEVCFCWAHLPLYAVL